MDKLIGDAVEACGSAVVGMGQSTCTRDHGHSGPHRCSAADVDARRAGRSTEDFHPCGALFRARGGGRCNLSKGHTGPHQHVVLDAPVVTTPRCLVEFHPSSPRRSPQRCVLPLGHDGDHRYEDHEPVKVGLRAKLVIEVEFDLTEVGIKDVVDAAKEVEDKANEIGSAKAVFSINGVEVAL